MKHQAMLIKSTEWFLCGGSSIKCLDNEIEKLQFPNMSITNFWSVKAIQPVHITLIILRFLQDVYNHVTKLQ